MGLLREYMSGFQKPEGRMGRFILGGMNIGHTPLSILALSQIEIQPNDFILDIGCGGGANIGRMMKKARNGRVCGIDHSAESVRISRKKNARILGKRCEILPAGADNIPYANGSFDKVTAFETIYFWKNIEECFAEVNRVLKNDGTFLIACEVSKGGERWSKIVDGMTVYDPDDLIAMLTAAGFYRIRIKKWLSYICITADKKPIYPKRTRRVRDRIFKTDSPNDSAASGSLKYKPVYRKILTPFIKRSLAKRIGGKRAAEILKKSADEYRRLCMSSPNLGDNNPFSYNAYFAYVYIAVWLGSGKELEPDMIGDIMAENLTTLKPLLGKINLNKSGGVKFAKEHMVEGYEKWYRLHGAEYPDTWHIRTDAERDGIYYELRNCPICALCVKLGIPEIMPALCRTDYVMSSLMHGKLTRTQTIADGGEMCDYHIVGDGGKK